MNIFYSHAFSIAHAMFYNIHRFITEKNCRCKRDGCCLCIFGDHDDLQQIYLTSEILALIHILITEGDDTATESVEFLKSLL